MSQAAREDPRVTANRRTVQQAALDLLSSDGIGGLTVERLADASGVSRSTIYRHWPDPRILVAAAFEDILGRGAEPEGAAGDPARDPAERLLEYLRDYARRLNDPTYATVLITVIEWSWRDPEFARAQARTFDDSRSRARAILQAGRTAGAFPTDLPIEEAVEAAVAPFLYRRLVLRRVITERQIRVLHARLTGSG